MSPTRVVLMSCGSYNPPTNMHLRMFEIARDHLHKMGTCVVVGGVISPTHDAYGKKELASATHRCSMLKLALSNSDWIRLSSWETRQNSWTRTRASLQYHQNLLNSVINDSNNIKNLNSEDLEWIPENIKNSNDQSPVQIKLLCGGDLLESFGIYGLWQEEDIETIVGQHGLVVITREGSNPNKFIYDSDILSKYMYNIDIVTEWISNEISSSRIRRALKRGESVRYLIHDDVVNYIYQNDIYEAKTPTMTISKLALTSPNTKNYLTILSNYQSTYLTPSPSDLAMESPSPIEVISIDMPDSILRKNIHNASIVPFSVNRRGSVEDAIRTKLISTIGMESGSIKCGANSKSTYPGLAKQIIATETGESQILNEVGFTDFENLERLREIDVLGNAREESIDQDTFKLAVSSGKYDIEYEVQIASTSYALLSTVIENSPLSIKPASDILESLESKTENLDVNDTVDNEESNLEDFSNDTVVEEQQVTELEESQNQKNLDHSENIDADETEEQNCVILSSDSIGIKELEENEELLSRIDPNPEIDGKYLKSVVNSRKSPKKTTRNILTLRIGDKDEISKSFTDDVHPTKIVKGALSEFSNNTGILQMKSVRAEELFSIPRKRRARSSSRSQETLPVEPHQEVVPIKGSLDSVMGTSPQLDRDSSKVLIKPKSKSCESIKCTEEIFIDDSTDIKYGPRFISQEEEFCSICCYANEYALVSKCTERAEDNMDTFYTVRSTCSSLGDEDSTECDICSSWNLHEITAFENPTVQAGTADVCEICEMCEEFDTATIKEVVVDYPEEVQYKKTNDDKFEIENCGSGETEPAIDKFFALDNSKPHHRSASWHRVKPRSARVRNQEYWDEDQPGMIGSRRVARKGSFVHKRPDKIIDGPERRRYSLSADNLKPEKARKLSEKAYRPRSNRVTGSVDNVRNSSPKKFKSRQRSADNFDSLLEYLGEKEDTQLTRDETVKMILTKHGIKIISDKETAL